MLSIANLFRPWILARLASGVTAAVLVIVGLFVAYRVLRHFRVSTTSEGQLALERRAELASTLIEVALGATIVSFALAVVGADRMTASIRGAMCAWGVLDASPWGFRSLFLSILAALACAIWIAIHRLDLRLRAPALTRAKFALLFVVGPLVIADAAVATTYALDLDLRVVASCCSTGLDAAQSIVAQASAGGPRDTAAALFVGAAIASIALGLAVRARPSARASMLIGIASLVAGAASIPAVVWWIAPHVYETPVHLCPFCLLHADVLGIGWPLFALAFAATALGASAGAAGLLEKASGEPATTRAAQARLASSTALTWSLALLVALAPIARWWLIADGASLFAR